MTTLTSAVVAAWFAAWAGHPTADHPKVADAIVAVSENEGEARWLGAIAIRESGVRVSIWGDGHRSACWAQVYVGASQSRGDWLNRNPLECAKIAVAALRTSMKTCQPGDELGLYAAGRCGTAYGKRISRDRLRLAGSFVVPEVAEPLIAGDGS